MKKKLILGNITFTTRSMMVPLEEVIVVRNIVLGKSLTTQRLLNDVGFWLELIIVAESYYPKSYMASEEVTTLVDNILAGDIDLPRCMLLLSKVIKKSLNGEYTIIDLLASSMINDLDSIKIIHIDAAEELITARQKIA